MRELLKELHDNFGRARFDNKLVDDRNEDVGLIEFGEDGRMNVRFSRNNVYSVGIEGGRHYVIEIDETCERYLRSAIEYEGLEKNKLKRIIHALPIYNEYNWLPFYKSVGDIKDGFFQLKYNLENFAEILEKLAEGVAEIRREAERLEKLVERAGQNKKELKSIK
jgi:hypothetical protein